MSQPDALAPRHAAAELASAFREAGIRVPVQRGAPEPGPGVVGLGALSPAEARRLAQLVRTGTRRTLKAARALRDTLDAYRIDLPDILVRDGRIALGATSPAAAERLARLLGAAPSGPSAPSGPDSPLDADRVAERLRNAFAATTGGDAVDIRVRKTPDGATVLALGSIDAAAAHRLVTALRF
ncbi:hypothetical protein ACFCV8_09115 [Streptomyces sp. NPDC056347]|uniref:hypothetical protein n=1 Tax=Streptomyces sp. NPDC056347 TaxID=3345790 RepID=UPI0035DDCADF